MEKTKAFLSCPAFLEIKNAKIPEMGLGVFAKESIKPETMLGKYEGEKLTKTKFYKRYPESYVYEWLKHPDTKRFKRELLIWKKNKRQGPPPKPCAPVLYPGNRSGYYVLDHAKKYIDAEDPEQSNWTRFINHKPFSKKANTYFTGQGNVKTCRNIQPGEELYINYGRAFFTQTHYAPL